MTTRRTLFAAAAALLPVSLAPLPARAASEDQALAFVDSLLRDLLAIVNGPGALDGKRAALVKIVETRVDVDAVARFCLGRFWRTATPQQQRDYLALFRQILVRNVTDRVGEYQGVSFTLGKALKRENDFAVATVVNRPGNAPNKVDWVVAAEGTPRIVDLVAEGTSLRLTQRSDYAAYLSRNGNNVQALIDALRQQVAG
jgi:phospholipid transport system substrate-binding protein